MASKDEVKEGGLGLRHLWEAVFLVALVGVAFLLRSHNLGPSTLTHDDAWVAYISRASFSDVITVGLTSPGFVFLEKIWLSVVGFSELKAQLLPFVVGVLTPAVAYLILRKRVRTSMAVLGALAMAYVPIHIIYSQHVKQYTGEVLLGLALIWLGWRILDDPLSERRWISLSALAVVAMLFSFSLSMVASGPILSGLCLLAIDRKLRIRLLRWPALFGFAAAGWYLVVIGPRIPGGLRDLWSTYAGEGRFIDASHGIRIWLEQTLTRLGQFLEWATVFPPKWILILAAVLVVILAIRKPLVLVMTVTPILLAISLATLDLAPLGGNRTDMYLLAPFVVGMTVGLEAGVEQLSLLTSGRKARSDRDSRWLGAMVWAGAIATVWGMASLTNPPPPYPLQDVKPLIESLEEQRADGDLLVIDYEAMYHLGLYGSGTSKPISVTDYGYRHYWVEFDDPDTLRIHDPSQARAYADEIDAEGDRMWFLVSINPFTHSTRDKWNEMTDYLRETLGWSMLRVESTENAVLELWAKNR